MQIFLVIYVLIVTKVVLYTQGFGKLSMVAASAAQSAANVVQTGTKDFTSKVHCLFRNSYQRGLLYLSLC